MRTMYAQFSTYKIFEHLELLYEPGFKRLNKGGALIFLKISKLAALIRERR